MLDPRKSTIAPTAPLRAGIEVIDASEAKVALVVDGDTRLIGTLTDGDVRRALLHGADLDAPVRDAMNPSPTAAPADTDHTTLLDLMRTRRYRHLPVVDADGRVVGIETLQDLLDLKERGNLVVLMAGGRGARLRPLTESRPKPLVDVGAKPILETIVEGFVSHGFRNFRIAVNYLADMVEEHFAAGEQWGARISYLREQAPLGTAGALALLEERPTAPFIVMNGDILTKVHYGHLVDFHEEQGAAATVCVREIEIQVPYGVVQTSAHRVTGLEEKPVQRLLVSAGIYVLDPAVLDRVPPCREMDMPQLLETLLQEGQDVLAFPLREYWMDIGQAQDLERANRDFPNVFG